MGFHFIQRTNPKLVQTVTSRSAATIILCATKRYVRDAVNNGSVVDAQIFVGKNFLSEEMTYMLLEMIQNDGLMPKRKTPQEYASACPNCGGDDRFLIFIETNKYWCRQCGKNGDAIQYLKDFHGMSFKDAADATGKVIIPSDRVATPIVKMPKKEQPGEWRTAARDLIAYAEKNLNIDVLAWLEKERGITEQTAKFFSLGWIPRDVYLKKSAWGLDEDGKRLFIPSGLVIPWQDKRIRVRRDDPGEYGRYHVVSGSNSEPFIIGTPHETTAIIVESELDAIILSQEITRKVFIVALGSCAVKPDDILLQKLEQCPVVLVALDTDEAGGKASEWWLENVPGTFRTLTPKSYGKDVTAAFLNGLDLNEWLSASLQLYVESIAGSSAADSGGVDHGTD